MRNHLKPTKSVEALLQEMCVVRGADGELIAAIPFTRRDVLEAVMAATRSEGTRSLTAEPVAIPVKRSTIGRSRDTFVTDERMDTMADNKGQGQSKGQQKRHAVNNADGTPYVNPVTGESGMTQEEWRTRDKSLGLTRPDGDEAEDAGTDTGGTTSQS